MKSFNELKNVKIEEICNYNENGGDNGFNIMKFSLEVGGKIYNRVLRYDYDFGGSFGGSEFVWGEDYKCEVGDCFIKFVDFVGGNGFGEMEIEEEDIEDIIDECFGLNFYYRK